MKYRKKPVVIEAIEYMGENADEVFAFAKGYEPGVTPPPLYKDGVCLDGGSLYIFTLEGRHLCRKGDFVIRGAHGELYPCRGDIFRETYEEVEGE